MAKTTAKPVKTKFERLSAVRNQRLPNVSKSGQEPDPTPPTDADFLPPRGQTPIKNSFKVTKRQWEKWSRPAQMTFNSTYRWVRGNQDLMKHPEAPVQSKEHWQTVAWNAAWMAADHVTKKYWADPGDGKDHKTMLIEGIPSKANAPKRK